jgi:hypothetical protein
MKEITDPGKKGHKKKTKHDQVHKKANPRWQGEKIARLGTVGEYPTHSRGRQGGREQLSIVSGQWSEKTDH